MPMPTWRSLDEAARTTGVSRSTIYRWIKAGLLRPYRILGDPKTYVDLDVIGELRQPRPRDRD